MRPHASTVVAKVRAGSRFAGGLARARLRGRPVILSHLITGRCNAGCPTCLWREDDHAPELDTDTVAWLYRQAADLGIPQLVVWGGEPLLRSDLPALLAVAREAGLVVTLITNGWSLGERWPELRGHVDVLILSLDDTGEAHDRLRGLPGLFRRLEAFTASVRDDPARPKLLVNTVLSRLNRGALRRVVPVAERWGAGLYFCPMETGRMETSGFADMLASLSLEPRGLRDAARLAKALKRDGYPLMATDRYLDLLEQDPALTAYACRAPRAILTVEADGVVRDCLRRDTPLARVDQLRAAGGRLTDVLALPRYQQMVRSAERCTACNNPDVLEISWLWDLERQMLEKAGRLITT